MSIKDFLLSKGIIDDEINRSFHYRFARNLGLSPEEARADAIEYEAQYDKAYAAAIAQGMSEDAAGMYASATRAGQTEEEAQTFAKAYDTAITLSMSKNAALRYASVIRAGATKEEAQTFVKAYDTAITLGMSGKEANTYAGAITLGMSKKEAFAHAKGPKFR